MIACFAGAAKPADEAADDGESVAESAGAAGVSTVEAVEDAGRLLESGALVVDLNLELGVGGDGGVEVNGGAGRGVVGGIGEEIAKGGEDEFCIDPNEGGGAAGGSGFHGVAGEGICAALAGRVEQIEKVAPFGMGFDGTGFDTGGLDELINDTAEAHLGTTHFRENGVARSAGFHGINGGADDGNRGAELVRNVV